MCRSNEPKVPIGIDPQDAASSDYGAPYNEESFSQIRVTETWKKYASELSWGKGQCLAILDDGCDLTDPTWQTRMPWGPKVVGTYNSIDRNDDPTPVPPGYHGPSVGRPSSMNHEGVLGIAYNNTVAQIRCVTIVHLQGQSEADTMAAALDWVLENRGRFNITAVNLSPLDDEPHRHPVATPIDPPLAALRKLGVWVSAPCGNNGYTDGISWPACQPHCYAIGGAMPGLHKAHLDRYANTDLLVAAQATSSSNAYAAACSMILREAIIKTDYPWQEHGASMSETMLGIFRKTGVHIADEGTNWEFQELDLLAAVDYVMMNE
jgi:hypothetical protein